MLKSIPTIRVFAPASQRGERPRLQVTSGVDPIGGTVVDAIPYRPRAVAPKPGWRPLTVDEEARLRADAMHASSHPGTTVSVLTMPSEVLAPFERCGLSALDSVEACDRLVASSAFVRVVEAAVPELWPFIARPEELKLCGVCVQRAGLRTTTTHDDAGIVTRSGLHIDSWDGAPFADRARCRTHVSVNLGRSDRFLIFSSLSAGEIFEASGGDATIDGYTGVCHAFFRRHPDAYLYRVRVRPGEGYIAPTDNILHDGTTEEGESPDLTLNMVGHFSVIETEQGQASALGAVSTAVEV